MAHDCRAFRGRPCPACQLEMKVMGGLTMPKFSAASKNALATAHPDLQRLFAEVIKHRDCKVLEGHRGKAAQDAAVKAGKSKTPWPTSKHNKTPSLAVDVVPYPIDWGDTERFYEFVGFVLGVASQLGIKVRSGSDWDGDHELHDQKFMDLPHFELLA